MGGPWSLMNEHISLGPCIVACTCLSANLVVQNFYEAVGHGKSRLIIKTKGLVMVSHVQGVFHDQKLIFLCFCGTPAHDTAELKSFGQLYACQWRRGTGHA